jgi:FlaG/FlaF family flagellin (archaellin)
MKRMKNNDMAVSPVVGVMLMLVVTIIIAAVVSGAAGGLVGDGTQKAPTLSMDVRISNSNSSPGFTATVTGVSDPIQTKDIKIVTSYKTTDKDGSQVIGGNTSVAGSKAPWGFGAGVTGTQKLGDQFNNPNAMFGNYTLTSGTGLVAIKDPVSGSVDNIQTVLGKNWKNLKTGDVVTVSVVHIPSGKMIFQKDVAVTGV